MQPLAEAEIRASFVNCSQGEARRTALPRDLAETAWADLDFLGWRDPKAPERCYLVTRLPHGPVGIALRSPTGVRRALLKTTVCSICLTAHPGTGVSLLVAPRAGAPGRAGNTVGTYMCADLACSLYIRGRRSTGLGGRFESLTEAERIERAAANLDGFVRQVLGTA